MNGVYAVTVCLITIIAFTSGCFDESADWEFKINYPKISKPGKIPFHATIKNKGNINITLETIYLDGLWLDEKNSTRALYPDINKTILTNRSVTFNFDAYPHPIDLREIEDKKVFFKTFTITAIIQDENHIVEHKRIKGGISLSK